MSQEERQRVIAILCHKRLETAYESIIQEETHDGTVVDIPSDSPSDNLSARKGAVLAMALGSPGAVDRLRNRSLQLRTDPNDLRSLGGSYPWHTRESG